MLINEILGGKEFENLSLTVTNNSPFEDKLYLDNHSEGALDTVISPLRGLYLLFP